MQSGSTTLMIMYLLHFPTVLQHFTVTLHTLTPHLISQSHPPQAEKGTFRSKAGHLYLPHIIVIICPMDNQYRYNLTCEHKLLYVNISINLKGKRMSLMMTLTQNVPAAVDKGADAGDQ